MREPGYRPKRAITSQPAGALLFALFDALALRAQTASAGLLPVELFASMPYAVTLIVLVLTSRRRIAPRALGHPLPPS